MCLLKDAHWEDPNNCKMDSESIANFCSITDATDSTAEYYLNVKGFLEIFKNKIIFYRRQVVI
jgi:hypothetical protein